jgi:hypothetical protein
VKKKERKIKKKSEYKEKMRRKNMSMYNIKIKK